MRFWRRLFPRGSQSVKQATTLIVITALLSNVLGLARNLVFNRFISPDRLEIYYVSFRIPDLIFTTLVFGAITSAFIPVISELINKEKEETAWKVTDQLLSWIIVCFTGLILVLTLFTPFLLGLFVKFQGADAAVRLAQAVVLTRILLWQTLFFAISFTLGSLLNGYRKFTTFALAPLVYNVSLIAGGFLAATHGLYALGASVVGGAFLHMLIQAYELRQTHYSFHFRLSTSQEIKKIIQLMIPRSISSGATQLVLVAYTTLATMYMLKGSFTLYSQINDLQTTPTVIIANSLATAAFPAMAGFIAVNKWDELGALLNKVIRTTLFALMPTIAICIILRAQIIGLYIGIGGAGKEYIHPGMTAFTWFMIGAVPAALVTLLTKVFYADKNARTPLIATVTSCVLAVLTASVLVTSAGYHSAAALAIGDVVLVVSQSAYYIIALHINRFVNFSFWDIFTGVVRYGYGTFLAAFGAWLTLQGVDTFYAVTGLLGTDHVVGLFIQGLLAGLVGIAIYIGYSSISCQEEMQWIMSRRFLNHR